MDNTNPSDEGQNSEPVDDRISGIEAAKELANQLIDERLEVDTRPERDGNGETVIDIEYPDRERICRDVVHRVEDAGYYVEEGHSNISPRNHAVEEITVTPKMYVIRVGDKELVMEPSAPSVTVRDADPTTEIPPIDTSDGVLAEPPLYSNSDDEGGQA